MPIIIDPRQLAKLQRKKRLKKFRKPRNPVEVERFLRNRLKSMWKGILFPASTRIKELVRQGVRPEILAQELHKILDQAELEYGFETDAVLAKWFMDLDEKTKIAINYSLRNSLGVDVSVLYDQQNISDALTMGGIEASHLIKTIPGDYLGQVARAVSDNFRGVVLPEGRSLIKQIEHLSGVSERRAKIIARDQTTKMQSTLTQIRQEEIGVEEYIWRNSRDKRVVGNPIGLYPKGNKVHMNHWEREGKRYRWDSSSPDGHPGQAILCRCWPEAVLDIKRILEKSKSL